MKHAKKLASLLLALVMVLSMSVTAFAANTTAHTITITNPKGGHTYSAYQVFKGDLSNGKLTNITWGEGVVGDDILNELKTKASYNKCENAADVADVLAGFSDNSTELDAFAKVVGKHLATVAGSSTESKGADKSTYTIPVTGDGYYLVKDTGAIGDEDAATKFILKVTDDVAVEAKAEVPELDKIIVSADDGKGKGTSVNVGDTVTFQLNSTVPEMDGYDAYTYTVHDTLSDGLTFDGAGSVEVTIDGNSYTDFTVTPNGQTFTIAFNNFINQKVNAGKDIVITYTATLNEKALTTDKESNTANLEYSNNPNDTNTSHTPDKTVYVYDFDIVIDKWAADEENAGQEKKLEGAMFVLKNNDGAYYNYNEETKKVTWVSDVTAPDTANMEADAIKAAWEELGVTVVTTDVNGAASFIGLDAGNYKLQEIVAPAGYNLMNDADVQITATYNDDGTLKESSATSAGNGQYSQTSKVENKSGSTLPSTGGIGTTIFYVVGSILLVGAVVLLIAKRRMSAEK